MEEFPLFAQILGLVSILAPIIAAITQVFKPIVAEKYYALIPVVVGLVVGVSSYVIVPAELQNIGLLLWAGVLGGLSASGVYSIQNIRNK